MKNRVLKVKNVWNYINLQRQLNEDAANANVVSHPTMMNVMSRENLFFLRAASIGDTPIQFFKF